MKRKLMKMIICLTLIFTYSNVFASFGSTLGQRDVVRNSYSASSEMSGKTLYTSGGSYGYNSLPNAASKELYSKLKENCRSFATNYIDVEKTSWGYVAGSVLSISSLGLSAEEAKQVIAVFTYDNPQFYWLSGSITSSKNSAGVMTNLALGVSQDYLLGSTRQAMDKKLSAKLDSYKTILASASTKEEAVKLIHDTIINQVDYAFDSNGMPMDNSSVHSIVGALTGTGAVCEGYAKSFSLLCSMAGIDCAYVTGYAISSSSSAGFHAWDIVQMDDGKWYYVDTTWDDMGGLYYDYYLVGKEEMEGDHTTYGPADTSGLNYMYALPSNMASSQYMPVSKITSATFASNMISVSWENVGADYYYLWRKAEGGSWTKLFTTKSVFTYSDTNITVGTTYYYSVQIKRNGEVGSYDTTGTKVSTGTVVTVGTPHVTGAKASDTGVVVTWNAASSASGYRVFRRTVSGSWAAIANVTTLTWTDTTGVNGTAYYYTVRAWTKDASGAAVWGSFENGAYVVYSSSRPNPPTFTVTESNYGPLISWTRVAGASGYRVYRRTATGSWSTLATGNASAVYDKKGINGTYYYYTIRSYTQTSSGSILWSTYNTTGIGITYNYVNVIPVSKFSVSASGMGAVVSWNSCGSGYGYVVYRKTASTNWVKLKATTENSFTDSTGVNGTTYYYTVRSYVTANGAYVFGTYNASGVSIVYSKSTPETPVLVSATDTKYGTTVVWMTAANSVGYRVFRREGTGAWKTLATITDTSYVDTTGTAGKTYSYTVRAYASISGSVVWSGYNTVGLSCVFNITKPAQPQNLAASAVSNGINISWSGVEGATGYRIYRRTTSGGWSVVATVKNSVTNYTDTYVTANTTYYYTVRAYINGTTTLWSSYDTTGVSARK